MSDKLVVSVDSDVDLYDFAVEMFGDIAQRIERARDGSVNVIWVPLLHGRVMEDRIQAILASEDMPAIRRVKVLGLA